MTSKCHFTKNFLSVVWIIVKESKRRSWRILLKCQLSILTSKRVVPPDYMDFWNNARGCVLAPGNKSPYTLTSFTCLSIKSSVTWVGVWLCTSSIYTGILTCSCGHKKWILNHLKSYISSPNSSPFRGGGGLHFISGNEREPVKTFFFILVLHLKAHLHPNGLATVCYCFQMVLLFSSQSDWLPEYSCEGENCHVNSKQIGGAMSHRFTLRSCPNLRPQFTNL